MKFSEWKILEYVEASFLRKEAETLKKVVNDKFQNLYSVPDFETFKRPGEPEQTSNLFTDKDLNTFGVNYTSKGKIYSIDFWKPESTKPLFTYYVEKGYPETVMFIIPKVIENFKKAKPIPPKFLKLKKSGEKVLQESDDDEVELRGEKPKPEISIDPEVKKAEKAVSDEYDFGDPDTIFEDLDTYLEMVIKGTQPSLLITGSPGVGKTYQITKKLKDSGLKKEEDYIHVKGRSTAAGMYITLYENNGKIIVFDDCDSVFSSPDAVNILKGALDSYGEREISWLVGRPLKTAEGKQVPKTFIFTGKVIFVSNLPQRKIDDAIKSRSFVLEVALTPQDMITKMRKDLPNVNPDVPLSIREEAMDFIEKVSKEAENLELNMRTLVKTIKILQEVDNLSVARRLILQQCSYK